MTNCACQRSFGVVVGILAAIGAALVLAGQRCESAGGQLSDGAWVCTSDGVVTLLWGYVTPAIAAFAASAGIAAYFIAVALVRRS